MNWPQLICDLFGKERKLKTNLIIKISNKVGSIVITVLAEQTFPKQPNESLRICVLKNLFHSAVLDK